MTSVARSPIRILSRPEPSVALASRLLPRSSTGDPTESSTMDKGLNMATASIEVSGPNAEHLARELQATLAATAQPGESVSPVEVERSVELAVAVIGLVFSGISTAKTIWDWWNARRSEGVSVTILLADGSQIDLSRVDQNQLQIELERRTSSTE
jgi:hypothetical protein